jgi:hypothetical protein
LEDGGSCGWCGDGLGRWDEVRRRSVKLAKDCGQQKILILAVMDVGVLLPQRHVMAYPKCYVPLNVCIISLAWNSGSFLMSRSDGVSPFTEMLGSITHL